MIEQIDFFKSITVTHENHSIKRVEINSFDYEDVNAHVIIDSTKNYLSEQIKESFEMLTLTKSKFLLSLSATNENALKKTVQNIAECVVSNHINVVNLVYTFAACRFKLVTLSFIITSQKTLTENLFSNKLVKARQNFFFALSIDFVFTNQNAQ